MWLESGDKEAGREAEETRLEEHGAEAAWQQTQTREFVVDDGEEIGAVVVLHAKMVSINEPASTDSKASHGGWRGVGGGGLRSLERSIGCCGHAFTQEISFGSDFFFLHLSVE